MAYMYREQEGYRFICRLFCIISRDKAIKESFSRQAENVSSSADKTLITAHLRDKWGGFSSIALEKNPDIKSRIFDHFDEFHPGRSDADILLKNYLDLWQQNAVKITDGVETRFPYISFGIAAAVAAAMGKSYSDRDFYIGLDEAKKILFQCLEYFGYTDMEFVPEDCFKERDNLCRLLFSALYSTLLFLYPNKVDNRESNYKIGENVILRVLKSDSSSELFSAFFNASEAKAIAEQLWRVKDINEQYIYLPNGMGLPVSGYYIVPDICTNRNIGLLTCEKGQAARSIVEGKSGCGKSTLARVISLICRNDISCFERISETAAKLDFCGKRLPVIIDCGDLNYDDLKNGIIAAGLKQMLINGDFENGSSIYRHFEECEKYLNAYCDNKIIQGELLIIIDNYSKLPEECIDPFNKQLRALCGKSSLHIVVLTDRLQPSAKFKLRSAFNGRYNEFTFGDTIIDADYAASVLSNCGCVDIPCINTDIFACMYVNTPRRLLRYVQSLSEQDNFSVLMNSCMEDEINTCRNSIAFRERYFDFARLLTLAALENRSKSDKTLSRLTVSEKIINDLISGDDELKVLWKCIKAESLMLVQCDAVNSMEFSTPLYFYCILRDYYMDILKNGDAGSISETFSRLSRTEFFCILYLIFSGLYEENFETISDSNAEHFIRAVVAGIFEIETLQDFEYCQWALSEMMGDEYKTVFIHGGHTLRREKMWRTLKRAYISLKQSKEVFCECGLLSSFAGQLSEYQRFTLSGDKSTIAASNIYRNA